MEKQSILNLCKRKCESMRGRGDRADETNRNK